MSAGFWFQHQSRHQIHVMPHNTGSCSLASDLDVNWRLKNTKETNLQNPYHPQHTCCMRQSQLCKRYWMLTHHTVCIHRVDGIITEWAEITTPLTYHQPRWTHSRLRLRPVCQWPACTRFHARKGDRRFCVLRDSNWLVAKWHHWERAVSFCWRSALKFDLSGVERQSKHDIFQSRYQLGEFHHLYNELRNDSTKFSEYCRTLHSAFDYTRCV